MGVEPQHVDVSIEPLDEHLVVQPVSDESATFNFTPYVAAAVLFVAITIPMTRFTDWLISRDRRRLLAAAGAPV